MFIPPLLTLMDDIDASFRISGIVMMSHLLDKLPPKVLEQTGLGGVIEEALMPTLSFLPNLTPVEESLALLDAAYGVLLKMSRVRFDDSQRDRRQKLLDRILRVGVLHGIDHCQENARIVRFLLGVMGKLIIASDVFSTKHLRVSFKFAQLHGSANY